MLKLITGRAKNNKTAQLIDDIKKRVQNDEKKMLMIVPEQYSHEAEREICRVCSDEASLHVEVISFTRLSRRVFAEVGKSQRFMDKSGKILALNRAVNSVGSRLKVYAQAVHKPELLSMLMTITDEFKMGKISSNLLEEVAYETDGSLREKLLDLSLILASLEAHSEQSALDPSDRISVLAECLNSINYKVYNSVYIDGFVDFTAQERECIEALAHKCENLTLCLTCDGLYGENEVFELSRATARWFKNYAEDRKFDFEHNEIENKKEENSLNFLEKHLFDYTNETFEDDGKISLFACDDISAECEFAASHCAELVSKGCRYRDIAISIRGFEDYRSQLEIAFARYDLPLYIAARNDVMQKPIPLLISSVIDAVTSGFEYEDVFAYLKTGLSDLSINDIDLLENYCLAWSVKGSMWTREFTMHPDGYKIGHDEKICDELLVLNTLRTRAINPLLCLHEKTKKSAKSSDFVIAISEFFTEIDLPNKLQSRAEILHEKGFVQNAKEYIQLWDMLIEILTQAYGVLGDSEMNFSTFGSLIKLMLSQCDVGSIPVSLDRISAGEMDRMRRRNIKHLLVLGASDMKIPKISESNGAFTDDEREKLKENGISLATSEDELAKEMNIIYNCITLPSESIMICFSRNAEDGATASPSFIINTAQTLFDKKLEIVDMKFRQLFSKIAVGELASKSFFDADEMSHTALAYLSSVGEGDEVFKLKTASETSRGSLTSQNVRGLYGNKLRISAARADKFTACKFAYFLQYGLKAKSRKTIGFNASEYGSFMHYILENVFSELYMNSENSEVKLAKIDEIIDNNIKEYIKTVLNNFESKNDRFKFLFMRLQPIIQTVVKDMIEELSVSEFKPIEFELNFSAENNASIRVGKDDINSMEITGITDRVDGYLHDGKLYIRVIDYKTGKKKFDLSDISQGLNLQLLIYLFALKTQGRARYKLETETAGLLYIPARDPLISKDKYLSDEEISTEKAKEIKRSGIVLFDEEIVEAMEKGEEKKYIPVNIKKGALTGDSLVTKERMDFLSNYIENLLENLAFELKNGKINAEPYYKSETDNACERCEFKTACYFNDKIDKKRYIKKYKTEEVWKILESESEKNG